ncbi:MAG: ATP-binding protein, partial [bacterium]|nr:ATP-binding protein [bacterium]
QKTIFPNIPIFPTERTTFITFPFPPMLNKDKQTYNLKENSKKDTILWISEPVWELLSIIQKSLEEYFDRKKQEIQHPEIKEFINLANFLEKNILFGDISFEEYSASGSFELIYKPAENTSLELNISSSMVKELAPLVLYLKYLAQPGDLLVIDEPEMNLHPAAQVEMTEFLCMLVNAGLNVLITTHSPYIVDHLSNLIFAKECGRQEDIKKHFYLEQEKSFIPKHSISVYL